MLIFTRRSGEAIYVGQDVKIRVLRIRGGQVQIGIDAPRTVRVDREEIHERRVSDGELPAPAED